MNYMQQMLQNKAQIAQESILTPSASRALKRALDPGREDFALRARSVHISQKIFSPVLKFPGGNCGIQPTLSSLTIRLP